MVVGLAALATVIEARYEYPILKRLSGAAEPARAEPALVTQDG
jgi:hypothetical protein